MDGRTKWFWWYTFLSEADEFVEYRIIEWETLSSYQNAQKLIREKYQNSNMGARNL